MINFVHDQFIFGYFQTLRQPWYKTGVKVKLCIRSCDLLRQNQLDIAPYINAAFLHKMKEKKSNAFGYSIAIIYKRMGMGKRKGKRKGKAKWKGKSKRKGKGKGKVNVI